jgi:hypothetical protein
LICLTDGGRRSATCAALYMMARLHVRISVCPWLRHHRRLDDPAPRNQLRMSACPRVRDKDEDGNAYTVWRSGRSRRMSKLIHETKMNFDRIGNGNNTGREQMVTVEMVSDACIITPSLDIKVGIGCMPLLT